MLGASLTVLPSVTDASGAVILATCWTKATELDIYIENNSLFVSVFSAYDGSTLQNLWFQREWRSKLLSQHGVARKLEDLVTRKITMNDMLSTQSLSCAVSITALNELFGQLALKSR